VLLAVGDYPVAQRRLVGAGAGDQAEKDHRAARAKP
jgi:hypothetical protein